MKINKKILIPVFATAMGLSVIGGITGAVAWYQYNSRVTASFVGTSVADTGVLEIGYLYDDDNNSSTPEVMKWGRDFQYNGGTAVNLIPVTFGAMDTGNALPSTGAWAYPEAGAGEGYQDDRVNSRGVSMPGWTAAEAGTHYVQFDIYVRATKTDATADDSGRSDPVARDVYISDYILSTASGKYADEALRIHIDAHNGEDAIILSKEDYSSTALNLYGQMDLDDSGDLDTYHSTFANDYLAAYGTDSTSGDPLFADGADMIYGVDGDTLSSAAISSKKAQRDSNGNIQSADRSKALFNTGTDANGAHLTITIWLEGWELLNSDTTAVWNPFYAAGTDVQFGLQFDTGIFRGAELTQYGA